MFFRNIIYALTKEQQLNSFPRLFRLSNRQNNLSVKRHTRSPARAERRIKLILKNFRKGAALLLVIICGAFVCSAQDKLRRVEQPAKFIYSNTPIQVGVSMDGKQMPDREAKAGPDWLEKISLEITNTSGKDINLLWINLTLKEPIYGASVASPETAGIAIPVELRHSDVKVLPAGDRITLKPPATMVNYWTKYAREHGITDIEKVILDIKQVGFTDGTVWTRGRLSRKDPVSGRMVFVTENSKPPFLHIPTNLLIRQLFFF